jgi:hypothetical protein
MSAEEESFLNKEYPEDELNTTVLFGKKLR